MLVGGLVRRVAGAKLFERVKVTVGVSIRVRVSVAIVIATVAAVGVVAAIVATVAAIAAVTVTLVVGRLIVWPLMKLAGVVGARVVRLLVGVRLRVAGRGGVMRCIR